MTTLDEIKVVLSGSQGPQGPRGDYPQDPVDVACDTTVTVDATESSYFRIEADQAFTLEAPTGGVDGQRVLFEITQDATGARAMTLGAGLVNGPISVSLSSDPNAVDFLGIAYHEQRDEWFVLAFSRGY
jgi:hypothetical protein